MGVRLHSQWHSETGAHAPATSTSILIINLNVFTININYVIIVSGGWVLVYHICQFKWL